MKIIILGAGQVGSSLAASLANEANDITVVDEDGEQLRTLQDHLDLRTVRGHAAYPHILEQAGAEDADMLVAVTNSDETNMIACQVAYTRFHTPTKIARIRAPEFATEKALFCQEALPIDVLISPEQLVTHAVQRLIETPGALQVMDFANGKVRLVAVKVYHEGALAGHKLKSISALVPEIEMRIVAIFRRGESIILKRDTELEGDDEVFFLAAREHIAVLIHKLVKMDEPVRNVILAGGGNIGKRLALALENDYQVKLICHRRPRAKELSHELVNTIVLQGDAADEELLRDENIERTDVFCAVTNDDQVNILSAMLAKRMGAHKVMALINRPAYVDLVQSDMLDIAISPQQATISGLLTHVRKGDVVAVHSLRRGAAEAIEAVAHGDTKTSRVVGKRIEQLKLPKGCAVGAIVRGEEVVIPHHETVIDADDHLILFLVDKRRVAEVERLFAVGIGFF